MKHQLNFRALFVACTLLMPALFSAQAAADNTIYLVRHAEKVLDGTRDPALTTEGEARAHWLATYFKDKGIKTILSTDYARTRDTALPTANDQNVSIALYDPRDLKSFAVDLKALEGTVLVAGHSNTTPVLAGLLVGEDREELDERVYDHIYIVTLADNGSASLTIGYSEPRTVLEVAELKAAIDARLGVMEEVAHYKWANNLAIEAPEREAAVLRATVTQATALGLGARDAESAVKAQMAASRLLQASYFETWKAAPPTGPVPDLEGSLRPRISALTETFLNALKAAEPYLKTCHTAAPLSRTDMTTPEVWNAATTVLLPKGGCS
ncbi:gamma subclass chorismate mutase AroQ [Kordiimonas sp.]|uniref:gamma subclass chorismate mutase AroQ n=1 Tax=Kordiimonas sp. TaxID=1970157 RepID=UPI003B52B1FB